MEEPQHMPPKLIQVESLRVETAAGLPIVEDVSFSLDAGEALGIVGETGSGKTTSVLAMLGYTHSGSRISHGEVRVGDLRITAAQGPEQRRLRGSVVSYVPQNPAGSLNPSMRIGSAVHEMIKAHGTAGLTPVISDALTRAGLPGNEAFGKRFPHQLSGGQQQRVCIAIALVCEPPVVILDEPATGLDVITQAQLLDELRRLRREANVAMVYVSHDLAVVAGFADRLAVMYAGRIVEHGPTSAVLGSPRHPYTRGLLDSIPDHAQPRRLVAIQGSAVGVDDRPTGCTFAPRCSLRVPRCEVAVPALRSVGAAHEARCLRAEDVTRPANITPDTMTRPPVEQSAPLLKVGGLRAVHRGHGELVVAASDVSFALGAAECVALVGESGSGKTTIARSIAGLHPLAGGEVRLHGEILAPTIRKRSRVQRRSIQMVFQDASDALNPRHSARTSVARSAQVLRDMSRVDAAAEADRLLGLVRLPSGIGDRYPGELSGGERQRVGIARALAANPEIMISDEITSALDVSVQAAVLNLLAELRDSLGLSLLLITHDLGVVSTIADRVLILQGGSIVETGTTQAILTAPQHPYTQALLAAAPSLSAALA